jgi:hypothetical protein
MSNDCSLETRYIVVCYWTDNECDFSRNKIIHKETFFKSKDLDMANNFAAAIWRRHDYKKELEDIYRRDCRVKNPKASELKDSIDKETLNVISYYRVVHCELIPERIKESIDKGADMTKYSFPFDDYFSSLEKIEVKITYENLFKWER